MEERKRLNADEIRKYASSCIDDALASIISGIIPADDVPESEYDLWFCQTLGEILETTYVDNDICVTDLIKIAMAIGQGVSGKKDAIDARKPA